MSHLQRERELSSEVTKLGMIVQLGLCVLTVTLFNHVDWFHDPRICQSYFVGL